MEAVITGAGSGLGRAFALELARRRLNLTLIDCDEERLAGLRAHLSAFGVDVTCCACDISDKSAVGKAANAEKTRVDLLINNAATSISVPFESTGPDAFDRVIGVNFHGAVHVTRAFLHRLGRGSQICNVCSSFSWSGFPGKSAYCSSKAALKTFSETARTGRQRDRRDRAVSRTSAHGDCTRRNIGG